ELAHYLLIESRHNPLPAIRHQRHAARLPRLEADGCARGDVEAHAAGTLAVEGEGRVRLVEMIVRADLDRPVAGIGDLDRHRRLAGVQRDLAGRRQDFARYHGPPQPVRPATRPTPITAQTAPPNRTRARWRRPRPSASAMPVA